MHPRRTVAAALIFGVALLIGVQLGGFCTCMIAVGSGVLAPKQNQQSHPDGQCPGLSEPLLSRLLGYASSTEQVCAPLAHGDNVLAGLGQLLARPVPDFIQAHTILGYSRQICISLSRNLALFSIPPPLA